MLTRLYSAAGNRVLWIDARRESSGGDYDQWKLEGRRLAQRIDVGQEITAVLFGTAARQQALFWNPDGSYEKVCGNAIRCLAHFTCEPSASRATASVRTASADYVSRKIDPTHGSVVMPAPAVRVMSIDEDGDLLVDVGTPHRIRQVTQEWLASDVSAAAAFSTGEDCVNYSLVHTIAQHHYHVRIFERGVGETSSCGTAAVSIVAALGEDEGEALAAPHRVQFDSGEELTVVRHPDDLSYEISGAVEFLDELSA